MEKILFWIQWTDQAKFPFFKVSVNVFLNWAVSVKGCLWAKANDFHGAGAIRLRIETVSLIIAVPR